MAMVQGGEGTCRPTSSRRPSCLRYDSALRSRRGRGEPRNWTRVRHAGRHYWRSCSFVAVPGDRHARHPSSRSPIARSARRAGPARRVPRPVRAVDGRFLTRAGPRPGTATGRRSDGLQRRATRHELDVPRTSRADASARAAPGEHTASSAGATPCHAASARRARATRAGTTGGAPLARPGPGSCCRGRGDRRGDADRNDDERPRVHGDSARR